jgi:hypothetical protein
MVMGTPSTLAGTAASAAAIAIGDIAVAHSPLDAERVLELAAKSLFDIFATSAMGTLVVDRQHRIVWISEGYKRFLPALGHAEQDSSAGASKRWCPIP